MQKRTSVTVSLISPSLPRVILRLTRINRFRYGRVHWTHLREFTYNMCTDRFSQLFPEYVRIRLGSRLVSKNISWIWNTRYRCQYYLVDTNKNALKNVKNSNYTHCYKLFLRKVAVFQVFSEYCVILIVNTLCSKFVIRINIKIEKI